MMQGPPAALQAEPPPAVAKAILEIVTAAAPAVAATATAPPAPPPPRGGPLAANPSSHVPERAAERGGGGDERPKKNKKDKKDKKKKKEKNKREKGDKREETEQAMGVRGAGSEVKQEVRAEVKHEEADHELGSMGSVQVIGAAPRTWNHKVVPTIALSKALRVPWLPTAVHEEPPALDAPLFPGPLNAHVTLQFVLQRTLQGSIQHAKPLGPG